MKRIAAIFFVVIFTVLTLASCQERKAVPCRDVLAHMMDGEINVPAGKIYSSKAESGSDEFLPDSLTSALFGNGSMPKITAGWLDCALFLSLNEHPCELAVVYCQDRDTALDTAKLLNIRIDEVKKQKGEQYAQMLDSAKVTVIGNYAVMAISTDSENAISKAKKAIYK